MNLRWLFRSKVLSFLFFLSFAWVLTLFLSPFTIPPGTVSGLDGYCNRIDHGTVWAEMPVYDQAIYYFGDATCHQKSDRTFYINGNQMAVCARDIAIYIGLMIGLFAAMLISYSTSLSRTFMNLFPKRLRDFVERKIGLKIFAILFIGFLFAPLAIDGTVQLMTGYESTNLVRVLTGTPLGFGAGYIIGVMTATLGENRRVDLLLKERMKEQYPVD
jgi:uncharacterized membrane protein